MSLRKSRKTSPRSKYSEVKYAHVPKKFGRIFAQAQDFVSNYFSANAIYWMNSDARFVCVNDQACKQLGYDRAELLRMSVHDIDPLFPKQLWSKHWKEVKERKSFTMESHHKRKSGEEFPVEVMVNYLEHEGRGFNCAVVIDISARKHAEEKIKRSEKKYRDLFEYSPIALWEEDFSEVKRYVGGIVSSEVVDVEKYFLDHPELMIKGAEKIKTMDVNKAALDLLGATSREDLWDNRIKLITERSLPIFSGIIATIAAGGKTYHGEGSGLNLIGEHIDVKMDFTVLPGYEDTYGKVLISMADVTQQKKAEEKLGHILVNLICNGIRYSDKGIIEISAKPSAKDGYVDIAVSDEGVGIPQERVSELFEPFKQLEETSKRRSGGIGLGLSIVKANLELIGSTIGVKSEAGKGSIFTINIPRKFSKKKDEG